MKVPAYIGWPLVVASGYGALCYWASRATYYPVKYPQGYWNLQSQIGAVDVWLTTADRVKVHAWWVPAPGAKWVTLYLHGNGGNLTHRLDHLQEISAAGSSVLIVDYRGYGKSGGRPTERGLYKDAEAAYRYLVDAGHSARSIVLHGESLGGAVAVDLAARLECAGVILEAPFTSVREVAAGVLPLLGPLIAWGFDSRSKIPLVRAPILVIHGTRDEVIPFEMGKSLFVAASEPKYFWELDGSGHNNIPETAGSAYRRRLSEFYNALGGSK